MSISPSTPGPTELGLRSASYLHAEVGSRQKVWSLVQDGTLRPLHRGWYISSKRWEAMDKDRRSLATLYARRLSRKSELPVVGPSAARLYGLFCMRQPDVLWLGGDDVSQLHGGRGSTKYRLRSTTHRALVDIHGILVTDPTDTLIDCALMLPRRNALVIADQLAEFGLDKAYLAEAPALLKGRRGVRGLRSVLERMDGAAESAGETLTRDLLWDWGIDAPVSQYPIHTKRSPYRADFAWPHLRLILEFDGLIKYAGVQPAADVVLDERERERALGDVGWTVIRTNWSEVYNRSLTLRRRILNAMDAATIRLRATGTD